MTRIRAILIVLLLAFLTEACQTLDSKNDKNEDLITIEIAVGEWKPFVTEDFEGYGEVPELITAILEEMGYQPVYKFMPWGQAEKIVRDNEEDTGPRITFPYRKTNKRENEFIPSALPVFKACIQFFYNTDKLNKKSLKFSSFDDLKRYKIGYVKESGGYQYPEQIDKLLRKNGIEADSLYEAFELLVSLKSNVQIVPEVKQVGEELLYELFGKERSSINIMMIEKKNNQSQESCLLKEGYYLMASKRNPNNDEFMKEFDKAHKSIENSEIAQKIKIRAKDRPTPNSPEIILDSCGESSNLSGRDDKNQIYHLPRGTKGLLLDWNVVKPEQNTNTEVEATVKILTGPHRGKKLIVDGRCLILH